LQAYEEESRRQIAIAEAAAAAPARVGANDANPATSSPANRPAAATGTEVAALTPQAGTAKPAVVELAPSRLSLIPGSAGRIKPAIPFQLAKAKLPLPVQGRQIISFGEKTQYGSTSKGIVLESRANAQVVSPCDGWVVYAREFRSYGQLLIINAGGGYHVLIAGMSQIDVQPGQFILAAEPVGTMSAVPKAEQDDSQSNTPVLYVEFHKDGQPIDPDPWWVESLEKVQG
jgi:septal ring factor EnvC (AmiA/AmiB activator)